MNILVVDDNPFILEVVKRMLSEETFDLTVESNVEDAIAHLEAGYKADLVITDIIMPERDGTKLAQYVKSQSPKIPVIAITGGVENAIEDYVHYAEMFADEVMQKPLKKDHLVSTIKKYAENKAA